VIAALLLPVTLGVAFYFVKLRPEQARWNQVSKESDLAAQSATQCEKV